MSFISFGFVNIIQVNQPFLAGPQVQTTLTSGPAFTERLFQEALKHRKPPPPPPRQLTAIEMAELELQRAESEIRSLPSSFYSENYLANADAVHEGARQARQNRDYLINKDRAEKARAQALEDARAEIRQKVKDAINARRRH